MWVVSTSTNSPSALLLPHLNPTESAESKDERRKRRVARLDKLLKAQKYTEWATKQAAEHPELPVALNPLCVICLEEVEDASQIRGLNCLHVFHQQCLDDWFGRWNEYCPLCHRPIITSAEAEAKKQPDSSRPGDGGGLVTAAAMV